MMKYQAQKSRNSFTAEGSLHDFSCHWLAEVAHLLIDENCFGV
jgi:hypothetical protein